jgi:probable HAF family extracellular repeat protein
MTSQPALVAVIQEIGLSMPYSFIAFVSRACLYAVIGIALWAVPIAQGQVQYASCKFSRFLLDPSNPMDPSIGWGIGANDWGTTVGQAVKLVQGPIDTQGFIRYSGGAASYYTLNGAPLTFFNARNNNGVTIGGSFDTSGRGQAFMLQGSTVTLIDDPRSTPHSTQAWGINKYNSIVGSYLDPVTGTTRGYKRYSNGSFVGLNYPGAQATNPRSINDSGAVVGTYSTSSQVLHGFLYFNGKWSTLDYELSPSANLGGISNTGVILGSNFIYANRTFKLLPNVPNSTWTEFYSMSPSGLITGRAWGFSGNPNEIYGFTANCK